jgi:hypothetical protein
MTELYVNKIVFFTIPTKRSGINMKSNSVNNCRKARNLIEVSELSTKEADV